MTYTAASPVATRRPLLSRGHAAALGTPIALDEMDRAQDGAGGEIDIRQLRHHTKNTLQRLLGVIAEMPGLAETPAGEKLVRELEHRICLSATISNALFGLTGVPGSMLERLRQLAGAIVDLMRENGQIIRAGVSVRGCCPVPLREAVLRSANELIGNAVKHGLRGRSQGRIVVRLMSDAAVTTLTVTDNGWGFVGPLRGGEGLSLARGFAERHGGTLEMDGADGTQATLRLPHPPVA